MREPLMLSVVIPTYNRAPRLRLTLEGLARQTWPTDQFEVLVVSDGSTDETEAMVETYAATSAYRLRLLTQRNAGPSQARNRGVEAACGEIIVFIDDDVEPMPVLLAVHAAHHLHADRIAVIGPMLPDPARMRAEPPWIAWEHAMLQKQYSSWESGRWREAGPHHFYSGNASLRRDLFLACGGFDVRFTRQEDVELACRLERECQVQFHYAASAAAVHRPSRSLASWLAIPTAYGRLDVTRARQGGVDWNLIRQSYHKRSRATRFLADLMLACPPCAALLRGLLCTIARLCYPLSLRRFSLEILSAVYNLSYLEAAGSELGTPGDMSRFLHQHSVPQDLERI